MLVIRYNNMYLDTRIGQACLQLHSCVCAGVLSSIDFDPFKIIPFAFMLLVYKCNEWISDMHLKLLFPQVNGPNIFIIVSAGEITT